MSKTALITGAATGIGRGLTEKLDAEGWTVFATYNRRPPDNLLSNCSKRVIPVHLDLSDSSAIHTALSVLKNQRDTIDLVVNNAGLATATGPIETLNVSDFKKMMDVNFWGTLQVIRELTPLLREAGNSKIINVGSSSVYLLIPGVAGYPVSKSAVDTLSRNLRVELAPFGIQVCVLHPGAIDTDMNNFEEDAAELFWNGIDDSDVRALYKKAFPAPGSQFENIKKMPADTFGALVYRKIVKPKRIKASYALGPYAGMTRRMKAWLPEGVHEAVQRSMAGVKKRVSISPSSER